MQYVTNTSYFPEFFKWLDKKTQIAIDTETTGLKSWQDKILLLQVGDQSQQWVFDCYKLGVDAVRLIVKALDKEQLIKIAHNVKFDSGMLLGNYGTTLSNWRCTMLGHELTIKGKKAVHSSLELVTQKYLQRKIDKTQQKTFSQMHWGDSFTDEQLQYAAEDVKDLITIWRKIEESLEGYGMSSLATLENRCATVTAKLEYNGIYLNTKAWLDLAEKAKTRRDEIRKELDDILIPTGLVAVSLFGEAIVNYSSPAQVKKLIEALIKAEIPDTNELTLSGINHPFVTTLLEYRHYDKRATTYGYEFVNKYVDPTTKRVHASYHQLGTETGRMSSSKPNGQNIPNAKEYRACFQPQTPDYKIISADFANQELRLLIQLSKEPALIKAMAEDKDIHAFSASLIYNLPYEDFLVFDEHGQQQFDQAGDPIINKEYKAKYRNPAKTITFG